MNLTLGFSPCPNDTFIFDALVNNKIDTGDLSFTYVMEDVETLNQWAAKGKLDITKLSYSAYLHLVKEYALLHSGSALGKGVGPLLVCKKENLEAWQQGNLSNAHIAIPGLKTTANLLLTLAHPEAIDKTEVNFSRIEEQVLCGAYDCGLVIHESRFTYAARGLEKIMDLGDWWEQTSGAAIPLGGIAMRRTLSIPLIKKVDELIKQSVAYSWSHYPKLSPFVTENAQEMETSVMRKHINLYVNEYTTDLGSTGIKAVHTLFEKAKNAGIIQGDLPSIFY